jgi:hypothetical protein
MPNLCSSVTSVARNLVLCIFVLSNDNSNPSEKHRLTEVIAFIIPYGELFVRYTLSTFIYKITVKKQLKMSVRSGVAPNGAGSVAAESKKSIISHATESKHDNAPKFLGKRPIKTVEKLTSMVFVCGVMTNGTVVNSENMMGKYIHNLESCDDDILAFSSLGLYKVGQPDAVSYIKFITARSGKAFTAALSTEGDIYTWGNGQTGELGLGLLYQQLEGPMKIEMSNPFVEMSCGANHVIAVDTYGNAYGWGQNFDKQLGLYTKEQSEMKLKSCVVEDLVFAPRFLPFSLKHPMAKV